MRISYIISLALKNFYNHKMRAFLTTGGIAVSVAFVVFLMSFGIGLQRISTTQIANIESLQVLDVSVAKSKTLKLDSALLTKLGDLGNVIEVQPQISSATKITYKGSSIDGVVYGKDLAYIKLEDTSLSLGKKYSKDSADEALINLAAQNQLSATDAIGKEITIDVIVQSDLLAKNQTSKQFTKKLKIVGIINDKSAPFVYVPTHVFKDNGILNYSSAKIKMKDENSVTQAKLQAENMGLKASSIKETVDQINKFFNIFQIILIAFGSIDIIVACIGMFNTLTVSLLEKTREVGFMKVLGTTKRDIYWLFTFESILMGAIGSIVGVLVGFFIGRVINISVASLATSTGNKAVEIFYMPPYLVLVTLVIAIIISTLTGLYPARRAAKISPLNAMRYE